LSGPSIIDDPINPLKASAPMSRKWLILLSVSFLFLFATGATFTSLGVVLFTMMGELHWSRAAGGTCFSVLGLTCGLSSPLPAMMMARYGTRLTLAAGALVLCIAFLMAATAHDLVPFILSTGLMGIGFTLVGNIPGVNVLAAWFPVRREWAIGAYLLCGGLGGVVGPAAVTLIVDLSDSWRVNWLVMAITALVGGLFALAVVSDAAPAHTPATEPVTEAKPAVFRNKVDWSYRDAIRTPQFLVIAATMVMTMMAIITVNSAAVTHLADHGLTAGFGASMLALQALVATLAKGAAGPIGERFEPRLILAFGMAVEAAGIFALSWVDGPATAYLFAILFGLGWGSAYFAANMLAINYFGVRESSAILSTVWLLTTVATGGPMLAGYASDTFGTYSPVFDGMGVLLIFVSGFVALSRPPVKAAAPLDLPTGLSGQSVR
jgi:MFS family permease